MKALRIFAGTLAFLFALVISLFILEDTLQYWSFEPGIAFLKVKENAVRNFGWLYLPSFYIHIGASPLVALLGLLQIWGWLRRKLPLLHRWAGRGYVVLVLFLAAPAGLGIAWFATGGLAGIICFVLLASIWWYTTWRGWRAIVQGDQASHRRWMERSFALTAAAIMLRFYLALAHNLFHENSDQVYVILAWASWVGNLGVVEMVRAISNEQ
ncbi:MAG: DUF2306 domain-containing protein [Bacteroidia bacterium]|nr:DUF2306 domain-containing protein [Bacteroidia bacterium]